MDKARTNVVMAAVFIATFMTSVETTVVTTSLPAIISDLRGLSLQSWVFAAYLLATAVTTPLYGKLSDRVGRKPVFIAGLCFFIIGSLLCSLSPSMSVLIAARVVQGIGAGAVTPVTFTIIADLVPYEQRAKILAMNNTAWGVSALVGPLIGGFLVDYLSWHWVFLVNVPLGLLVLILITTCYKGQASSSTKLHVDVVGMVYLSAALISMLLGFQLLSGKNGGYFAFPLFGLAIVCVGLFIHTERKASDPIIPLTFFRSSTFNAQILSAMLLSGAQIGFQVYFPIWLQSLYAAPASIAGLAVTPSPVMWLVSSFFVGALLKRWAPKRIIIVCTIIQAIAYLPLVMHFPSMPMLAFYIVAGITGTGLGIVITTNTMIAQHLVPPDSVGAASSMLTLGRTLGQAVMTGVYGLVFNWGISARLANHPDVRQSDVNGFISSTASQNFSGNERAELGSMILPSLREVMVVVLVMFGLTLVVNVLDKQKVAIK
jgi:EmrB/QacA subfamily drug resistance transporter